jgi:energy-coupling factor transporter ATP-binding protein EcfA2
VFSLTEIATHYFARGNTARGAHFLYPSAFQGLEKLFVLTGPPGTGKSTVLSKLADGLISLDHPVQFFHSPLRPEELDGIICPHLKIGFIDGDVCGALDAIPSIQTVIPYAFENAINNDQLSVSDRTEMEELGVRLENAYNSAYEAFNTALKIHDEWEAFYIEAMDFGKADEIAEEWKDILFGKLEDESPVAGRRLFFGAATPKGAFDFIQSLTAPLERRIFIKGRPGSGKSTLLKKLAAAAEEKGVEVQIFHCGFDPNSLDMLIFPTLSTAIFDSTAPHEYFPNRIGDEVLDMYARTMKPGIDEAYAAELADIKARYSTKMKQATSFLAEAEALDSRIKAFYTAATDFSKVDLLLKELESELTASAETGS